MAYIEKRALKGGGYTYRINSYRYGTRYRTNFRTDATLTEHQSDKAAERVAMQFEEELDKSWYCQPSKDITLSDWIDYMLSQKEVAGRKKKTISGYAYLSVRVKEFLGNLRVCDISPADVSRFFAWLAQSSKSVNSRAVKKEDVDLLDALQNEQFSRTSFGHAAGLSKSTVTNAVAGKTIALSSAEKIARKLSYDISELFDILCPTQNLSQETMRDYRRFLSLMLSSAQREGIITANPMDRMDRPLTERIQEKPCLQPDEIQKVWQAAQQEPLPKRCLIHLLMVTGCRRGEIAGLRWSRVLWEESTIKIDRTIQYTRQNGTYEESTKSRQTRLIRLPDETLQLLEEYHAWQRAKHPEIHCEYVFTNDTGRYINPDSISSYIRKFQQKYHLPNLHPHLFRHSMASLLYYMGQDPVSISKRLGHANVSTTQNIYSHLIQQADTKSAELIADVMFHRKD